MQRAPSAPLYDYSGSGIAALPGGYPSVAPTPAPYSPPAVSGGGGGGTSFAQPATGGMGGGTGMSNAAPAPIPRAPFDPNSAFADGTFMMQRQGFNDKLANFANQIRGQVGNDNLTQTNSDQSSLDAGLTPETFALKFHDPNSFAKFNLGANGENGHYVSNGVLGGTMGTDYNKALAGLDLSRVQGLTNLGEDFAARGLGNSGVYLKQADMANKQYGQQYDNLNSGVYGQANDLVNQLANQAMSTQQNIASARSDAVQRLQNNYNAVAPLA
jgi:hypothetical protein